MLASNKSSRLSLEYPGVSSNDGTFTASVLFFGLLIIGLIMMGVTFRSVQVRSTAEFGLDLEIADGQGPYSKHWPHWSKPLLPEFLDLIAAEEAQLRASRARRGWRPVRWQPALYFDKWTHCRYFYDGTSPLQPWSPIIVRPSVRPSSIVTYYPFLLHLSRLSSGNHEFL